MLRFWFSVDSARVCIDSGRAELAVALTREGELCAVGAQAQHLGGLQPNK